MSERPPNYRESDLEESQGLIMWCHNCKHFREYELHFACIKYVAYVRAGFVCDSYEDGRITGFNFWKSETSKEELELLKTSDILDLRENYYPNRPSREQEKVL